MRRLITFSIIIIGVIFAGCKKENLVTEELKPPSYENLIPKIKSWIDEQKKDLPASSVTRIESLESNLSYEEIRLEEYREGNELIIIPILSEFKSTNNSDKNPVNYLVLVLENQERVIRGNIVQYISASRQNVVPQNTFHKIFTYKSLDCSGQFVVLGVTDAFQYELKFENGELKYITDLTNKAKASNSSGRVQDECIDWYLQTWYVWADGTAELISEVYVYTTCGEGCAQPRIANGRMFNNCGGGGGGGGNPVEYTYAISRPWKWDVMTSPDWWAQSYETVSGIRSNSEPYGGHFTDISHNNSYFVTFITGWTWTEVGKVVSVDNPQRVYATVSGRAALGNFNNIYSNWAFGSFTQLIGP